MINIIFDENNNIKGDKILNLTIFTKDNKFFYIFFKSTSIIKSNAWVKIT